MEQKRVSIDSVEELNQVLKSVEPKKVGEIEFDLPALIKKGVLERDVTVGDFKFKMHVLTTKERLEALGNITESFPYLTATDNQKVQILSYSITSCNDKTVSREQVKEMLLSGSSVLVDLLYGNYLQMVADQINMFQQADLKKNGL